MNENEILGEVRGALAEILGSDQDLHGREIALGTSFSKDLELESIEFVVLSEKLQAKYGDKVDFAAWLAGKELDEIINLQVGDVVSLIKGGPHLLVEDRVKDPCPK